MFFVPFVQNDPNDDETSDDPADDDDAWEGLNAFDDLEVPIPAWFRSQIAARTTTKLNPSLSGLPIACPHPSSRCNGCAVSPALRPALRRPASLMSLPPVPDFPARRR